MKHIDVIKRYEEVKNHKQKFVPLWRDIAKYTGIKVDADDTHNDGEDLDSYTLDPTTSLMVVQSADYLKGIIIGTGDKGFELFPSDELLEMADASTLNDWFQYATQKH